MKKFYLFLSILFFHLFSSAQPGLAVAAGTDLFIASSTVVSSEGLSITPSSNFTLNGVTLTKTTTASHSIAATFVSRFYQFSANTSPFSGTVQFNYLDAELNGLNEATLEVNIHNGTSWQAVTSAVNDGVNNFVGTNSFTTIVLNELGLAEAPVVLPLQWGAIIAYRQLQSAKIEWTTMQENNVSHFTVERSLNGQSWITVVDNIQAGNTAALQKYIIIDKDYNTSRMLYRIRQTDKDGRFTYSGIAILGAESESNRLLIYPNPTKQNFYIGNIAPGAVKLVRLYTAAGILVKSWASAPPWYNIEDIAAGIYQLRIELKDGSSQQFKINKQ